NGFLDVFKMGTSNVYVINQNLAWSDKNTYKKYTKYDGKKLVSKKEKKDYQYRNRFDRLKALRERENMKRFANTAKPNNKNKKNKEHQDRNSVGRLKAIKEIENLKLFANTATTNNKSKKNVSFAVLI